MYEDFSPNWFVLELNIPHSLIYLCFICPLLQYFHSYILLDGWSIVSLHFSTIKLIFTHNFTILYMLTLWVTFTISLIYFFKKLITISHSRPYKDLKHFKYIKSCLHIYLFLYMLFCIYLKLYKALLLLYCIANTYLVLFTLSHFITFISYLHLQTSNRFMLLNLW